MKPTIDVETLRGWLEQGRSVTILDIRGAADRANESIPGSIPIDACQALEARDLDALAGVDLPADTPVVTVCGTGQTSLLAAEQLRARGFSAFSLDGGMRVWGLAGRSSEAPTSVNRRSLLLLMLINAFVGAMVGLERTLLPLVAEGDFRLASRSVTLGFLIGFGVTKAVTNLFAGCLADRLGRRSILITGWLVGLPVPLMIMAAPSWDWVILANLLLGLNQGLCWSMTVVMMIDVVGPRRRGLATGLNEFAGYLAVAATALLTGYMAAASGLRPWPFVPGLAFAGLGLLISALVPETRPSPGPSGGGGPRPRGGSLPSVVALTSWKDRSLFAASQAGMATRLNDGIAWGLLPLFFTGAGLSLKRVGLLAALYPAIWGLGQLVTGPLSDRWGRKGMIVAGMWCQAAGMAAFAIGRDFAVWFLGSVLLGLGTALVYPTLIAAVSDRAHPDWRASAVGVYRLWRDSGYVLGALFSGLLADAFNVRVSIAASAGVTCLSGMLVSAILRETLSPAASAGCLGRRN
jgi:MFS family permease/rhodanese-related sulfurtransferase